MVAWRGAQRTSKRMQRKLDPALFWSTRAHQTFLHSFSAWAWGVCEHSDFFLKLSISQNIFKFYGKVVKSLGQSQIWWKTESTNFGHIQTWKIHCFEDVFIAMGVSSNLKWSFLKFEMILGSNFRFEKDRASKEKGFHHYL